MVGIFGEFAVVSVSQETNHEKPWNTSGKIRSKFGEKFGAKIRKIRGLFVTARVGVGGLLTGWPGVKRFYVLCAESKGQET